MISTSYMGISYRFPSTSLESFRGEYLFQSVNQVNEKKMKNTISKTHDLVFLEYMELHGMWDGQI